MKNSEDISQDMTSSPKLEGDSTPHYLEYHHDSYLDDGKPLPTSRWPDSWKRISFKGYPRFDRIQLERTAWNSTKGDLLTLMIQRGSRRALAKGHKLSREDISYLLLGGAITRIEGDLSYRSYRAYPSGGARYPSEIYLLLLQSKDLPRGAYHYHVRTHSLEYMWPVTISSIKGSFPGQSFATKSSLIFIITAMIRRSAVKYNERSYRFALLEAGHLGQNICLLAEARKLNAVVVGGFHDENLSSILDINGEDEFALSTVMIS